MTRGGVDLGLGFTVTPDNVLDAYAVIAEEATRLNLALQFFRRGVGRGMAECGADPVSFDASREFTDLSLQLADRCQTDVNRLQHQAETLAKSARDYGKTDTQIAAALSNATFTYHPAHTTASGSGSHR